MAIKIKIPARAELEIETLGAPAYESPLGRRERRFAADNRRILLSSKTDQLQSYAVEGAEQPSFEVAGPRERVFFRAKDTVCGIVTCGGLCPGLNDVIRSLTMTALEAYGVRRVLGFRYGYAGLSRGSEFAPLDLSSEMVKDINEQPGTVLGSSRGPQDIGEMIEVLQRNKVNILFTIGGDGTLRGAGQIAREIIQRGLKIAVIGVPKTIDNDLSWTTQSFGFSTAVDEAKRSLVAAHAEARGVFNGIGLVKLMGRHSGFIAAHAALALGNVNFCLIPEVPFALEGEQGFLPILEQRLDRKHHAVIVAAEGAGQELTRSAGEPQRDASGNIKLTDIGLFLKGEIKRYFQGRSKPVSIKYIDPSYIIRSQQANATDSQFCMMLGQHAVHAGMAGHTGLVVSLWNGSFVHVPISVAVGQRKQIDPDSNVWRAVLECTHQPARMF